MNILIIINIYLIDLLHYINSKATVSIIIKSLDYKEAELCVNNETIKIINKDKDKDKGKSIILNKIKGRGENCYSFDAPSGQIEITVTTYQSSLILNGLFFNWKGYFIETAKVSSSISALSSIYIGGMFYRCKFLKSIDFTNFDMSKITSLSNIFKECYNLTSVKFGNVPKNLYKMNGMFYDCSKLVSIDLSIFDTSKVVDMQELFCGCAELVSLNIKTFNVEQVKSFQNMFAGCKKITSLDLDNFKTLNAENMTEMFRSCISLKNINLKNFDVSKVKTMNGMFRNCNSLTSLNLSNFISSTITDISYLFEDCSSLTLINLNNFVSGVYNMSYMFHGCISLVSLDLNILDTSNAIKMNNMFEECILLADLKIDKLNISSVQDMSYMFYNCKSLPYLNISNWKGTNIRTMKEMFNGCLSLTSLETDNFIVNRVENLEKMFNFCLALKSLNLINFNISLTKNMASMFFGCKSLLHLNINNFETKNVVKMENMFRSCESLTSLNISNFLISNYTDYQDMFFGMAENLIYCVNDDFYEKIKLEMNEKKCAIRNTDCFPDWKNFSKKIIVDNGKCVESCNTTDNYKFEYEGKCYSSCPIGTTSFYNKNFLCEIYNEKTIEIKNNVNNQSYKFCQPEDFLKNKCNPIKNDNMISLIKNDISDGKLNNLLENVLNENKIDICNSDGNVIYQITSSFNQKNKIYGNISTLNLEQCEDDLKNNYNINPNDTLIIFKYDYYIREILIPIVGYEIFHPKTKKVLDSNICKNNNNKINITTPVNINENEIYKHDPNNNYYNDRCNSYSNDKGVDMTIFTRKNDYNENNLALCPDNCDFEEYNNQTKQVKCLCDPQFNSSLLTLDKIINKQKLLNNFINIEATTNLDVIKCYKNLLSLKGLKSNIGSYIILSIILIYNIGVFVLILIEYKMIIDKFDKIVTNITKTNNSDLNLNNPIKKVSDKKKNKSFIKIGGVGLKRINNNNDTDNSSGRLKSKIKKNSNKKNKKEVNLDNNINMNDSELNMAEFLEAKKLDKRSYWEYYFSLVKTRHPLLSSFLPYDDLNSKVMKICLLFFTFALSLVINSLFFNDRTMHKIYIDEGIFNFVYNLPKIIYSFIISDTIIYLMEKLALSEKSILDMKKEKNIKKKLL